MVNKMDSLSPTSSMSSFVKTLPDHDPGYYWRNDEAEELEPYAGGAVSNYPGGSNLLYIPADIYYTGKALVQSVKRGDNEEVIDATTRLAGIPANIVSAAGTVVGYGVGFGIIPTIPWFVNPITMGAGLILCVVEGIVDIISLVRQNHFEKKFDFELLSHLKNMVADIDPSKTADAVKKMTKLVNEDPESLKFLLGPEQAEVVKNLMNKIQQEIKNDPHLQVAIINHHKPALEEIARQLLVENLVKMRHDYLQVSATERTVIEENVRVKHPTMDPKEQQALIKKELAIASEIKKKKLARRIRPWMVEEMNETVNPLLKGIVEHDPEAIKEGLRLTDDIHVQLKKKRIIHILGIIALVFAAASIIALMITCPVAIPYILAGIALTIALVRAGIIAGTLDSRGWTFEPKKMLPQFIQRKIFSKTATPPEIRHKYRHSTLLL